VSDLSGPRLRLVRGARQWPCILLRREAFAAAGWFNARFRSANGALVEWFYRARSCGYRWAVDGQVECSSEPDADDCAREPDARLFKELHGCTAEGGPIGVRLAAPYPG
jgi:hypothetical protein